MKPGALRLILAVALFAGWIGYLGYLVATTRSPIILSRPQFLTSNLDVIARIEAPDGADPVITITEVHWPRDGEDQKLIGTKINVPDLTECSGWNGSNTYILPLTRDTKGVYRVAPIPPSPGYDPHWSDPSRIYLDTPQTRQQLEAIQKPTAIDLKN